MTMLKALAENNALTPRGKTAIKRELKRRRVNNRPIWMKKNVLRVIRKKKRLWRAYKETR